ncbi:helix-turn-helix domain-containing protein [Thiolapillus sp.]|uniref:helix-turn-helix domain-containing protein n=3 Tax=Thiolapillus sp. TaxID=2017437 RepID=UPI0025D292BC|nr:helix-turn-helix transcriptional regulator [Thiolapillus sp.]
MMQSTPSASASSAPTKSFERVFGDSGTATSRTRCQVFAFEAYTTPSPQAPAKHSSISQLSAEWEGDAKGRAALEEGRQWVADTFYGEDGDTVRTLRLRKGWSQARLAEALATSQPHIARIERGRENLTIETCRKLTRALEIDLNTLDQALKRQEAIAQARQK